MRMPPGARRTTNEKTNSEPSNEIHEFFLLIRAERVEVSDRFVGFGARTAMHSNRIFDALRAAVVQKRPVEANADQRCRPPLKRAGFSVDRRRGGQTVRELTP